MTNYKNTKKLFLLSVAATALLLIPRRSSRKDNTKIVNNHNTVSEGSDLDDAYENAASK
ncbi:hypothetical protein QL886_12180 [Psychrobacter sp. APC 3281]|uniref:hypothetical protein n=1 Tax=Psychrobacter sp. APC 3281 TaxID=3035190 RepID=UPI0025B283F7|nr:hypothetical protein [Psychrobacter sp. APC 3281]MDN3448400.1 hypothetical protein [Psychrobacter sp. APC 3281]